ncbi:CreA family protein, partial [Hyphomonas sp. UBA3592]
KGNWFENPSNSSISCLQSGPIRIGRIDLDKSGEEVFDQNQSLVFKQLAVRRIYDADSDSLMYVSYSRKIVDGSAKMSLSTVPLFGRDVTWQNGKPASGN